jgi:hypothetical protein
MDTGSCGCLDDVSLRYVGPWMTGRCFFGEFLQSGYDAVFLYCHRTLEGLKLAVRRVDW